MLYICIYIHRFVDSSAWAWISPCRRTQVKQWRLLWSSAAVLAAIEVFRVKNANAVLRVLPPAPFSDSVSRASVTATHQIAILRQESVEIANTIQQVTSATNASLVTSETRQPEHQAIAPTSQVYSSTRNTSFSDHTINTKPTTTSSYLYKSLSKTEQKTNVSTTFQYTYTFGTSPNRAVVSLRSAWKYERRLWHQWTMFLQRTSWRKELPTL